MLGHLGTMRINDPHLPQVFTRAAAAQLGFTGHQMDTRVRNEHWRVLARGCYCLASTWATATPEQRQVLGVTAALRVASYPAWASHASAAALLELPVPKDQHAWITRQPPGSTRYGDRLTVEVATLPLIDQWSVRDFPVTSLRRTVADNLRHQSPPNGLAMFDAAARRVPGIVEGVGLVLAYSQDWPYAGRAAQVFPLVDGRRESPLESWSAWYMHRFAVPAPEPQVDLFDEHGTFLGRADFWWDEFKVAGEADGRTKYAVRDGETIEAAQRRLLDEKRREDGFRRTGAGVVRWGTEDLMARPWAWAEDVKRGLRAHDPRLFRGYAVPHTPRAA